MSIIQIRFYARLNRHLPPHLHQRSFKIPVSGQSQIKDVIDSLGVPYAEVGLITADGVPVDFSYCVKGGERFAVYPFFQSIDITGANNAST